MGTAFARVSPLPEVYKRASAYAMRGEMVDGMDVIKVYDAVRDCAAHCRAGKGPVLLETNTYRYRGHSMSDPATYRTKGEVELKRKDDPIPKLRHWAVEHLKLPEADFEAIDAEVKATVDAAVKFADESPEPSLEELHTDIFVEPGEQDVRPRERVHGVKVEWPSYPSGQSLKVTWDLEPREQAEEAEEKAGMGRQPARA